jgi:hypothetical protein
MNGHMLRTCAAGNTSWLGHNSTSFGGRFLCPRHLGSLMHGFNPQPAGVPGGTDSRVKFIDGSVAGGPLHAERYEPEFVVLSRDGDMLTLRRLGFPDSKPIRANVHAVYPASPAAVYRHASKCGAMESAT